MNALFPVVGTWALVWLRRYNGWLEDRVRLNAGVRAFLWVVKAPRNLLAELRERDPRRAAAVEQRAREAVERLLVFGEDESYCQPCLSPIWDTCLAAHALLESGERDDPAVAGALDYETATSHSVTVRVTDSGGLTYDGPYYQVKIPMFSRPRAAREQIPVCLAAVNRGMIRAAAAAADEIERALAS